MEKTRQVILDIFIGILIYDIVVRKLIFALIGFRTPIILMGYLREAFRFMIA